MAYCTVLDVARASGIYNQTIAEAVGTGDGLTTAFSFDNNNVVDDSDTIYVAGIAKTRTTEYSINNNTGAITFMTPPAQNAAITADYKFFPDTIDLVNADVEDLIEDADDYIEGWTGKSFSSSTSATEYFEGRAEKVSASGQVTYGQYYEESFEDKYVLMLSHYPVTSITSLVFLEDDGTVDETLTEADEDFHWWDYGKVQLISASIPEGKGKKKVRVVYTYGYSAVPRQVKRLSAVITSIMLFTNLTGGSFDEITSYSLGPKNVSVGEPYMNMRAAIERLEKERDALLEDIGREFRQVII